MEKIRFSSSGEIVAVAGQDGRLRLYECETSKFLQEFISSNHLSAVCTCLEWAPSFRKELQVGRKKRKKMEAMEGDVIVLGTSAGSILFYNVTKAELMSKSQSEHAGKVTGLSWSQSTMLLYSCGEDGHLIEWDPTKCAVISRWKGSQNKLTGVRTFKENLLAAGQSITLWDLKSKTILTTFTGHPNFICQLETICSINSAASDYFISMGQNERHVKIWCPTEKNAVANLAVPEIPQYLHATSLAGSSEVVISAATERGILYIFRHTLNGPLKKALMPSNSLKILDSSDKSKIVPIITCFLNQGTVDQSSLTFLYGDWARFQFEKLEVSSLEKDAVITRQFSLPSKSNLSKKARQEIDRVEVPNDVKHLQPGSELLPSSSSSTKKRKKGEDDDSQKLDDGELPMEERLMNLTMENTAAPRGNNLAHLLSQGLHSKDHRILQSVLSRWDEDVVTNTVRSLPVQLIVPLLNEIKVIFSGKGQFNNSNLCWLKAILKIHSSYLMCCPNVDELLTPFMSLLHTRQVLFPQMCKLRGKLELIKGHIEAKQYSSEPPTDALLKYNDDSPDEDADDDRMLLSESEDLLTSDDLGVEDSDDEEDAEKSGSNADTSDSDEESDNIETVELASDSENEDEGISKKNSKSTRKSNSKNEIKGKIIDEDSEAESMDED